MSPEMWQNNLSYDLSADVWSLGVLLYYLCCLDYPFKPVGGNAQISLIKSIVESDYEDLPANYSIWVHQLVDCMLNKNPLERPNAKDILEFPPVAKYVAAIMEDDRYRSIYDDYEENSSDYHTNLEKNANEMQIDEDQDLQFEIEQANKFKLNQLHQKLGLKRI